MPDFQAFSARDSNLFKSGGSSAAVLGRKNG